MAIRSVHVVSPSSISIGLSSINCQSFLENLRSSTLRSFVQFMLLLVEECTWSDRRTVGRVTLNYHRSLQEIAESRSFA